MPDNKGIFKRYSALLVLVFALFALAGCLNLNPGPPPSVYMLNPALLTPKHGPAKEIQLSIVAPSSDYVLSGESVVTMSPQGEVRYWANTAWSSPVPALLQGLLVKAFEPVNNITAMPNSALGFLPDYRLLTELRQFAVLLDAEGRPEFVQVALACYLIDLRTGKSLGYLNSEHKIAVKGEAFTHVLAAYNEATGATLNEITAWATGILSKAKTK